MSAELTDAEREALATWDSGTYSCACRTEICQRVPCHNDRDDLYVTVAHLIAARVRAAKAEAWGEGNAACCWPAYPHLNPYREGATE